MNFLNELKRRNIYKAATLYVVAGWVILQVSDTVLPAFGFTDRAFRIITIVLLIGFPVAIMAAWLFEITDKGIRKTLPASNEFVPASATTDYIVILLLLVVVVLTSVEQFSEPVAVEQVLANNSSSISADQPTRAQVTRSRLNLGNPDPKTLSRTRSYMVLSNDGQTLAYTFRKDGVERLMLRDLGQLEARVLWQKETGALTALDFSPDDSRIVFNSGRDIHVIDVASGVARIVVPDTEPSVAPLWSSNEEFLVAVDRDQPVYRVDATTGTREELFQHEDPSMLVVRSRLIPERNAALLTISMGGGRYRIDAFDLDSGESKILVENAIRPDYTSTGHLVFVLEGSLWAAPFDLNRLEITGLEKLVVRNIESTTTYQLAAYSFSDQGRLVYIPNDERELNLTVPVLVSLEGEETPLNLPPYRYSNPVLSPDGLKLAIKQRDGTSAGSLWIYDMTSEVFEQRTFNERLINHRWSRDSERIFFSIEDESEGISQSTLYEMRSSGLGGRTALNQSAGVIFPQGTARDDSAVLVSFLEGMRTWSVGQVATDQEDAPLETLFETGREPSVDISPDGNYLVHTNRAESGLSQTYIRPYPNLEDGLWSLPPNSAEARWSRDGTLLFYVDLESTQLMAIPVSNQPPFFQGRPRVVTENFLHDEFSLPNYSLGADNNSVIVLKRIEDDELYSNTAAIMVDNWFAELSQLVPNFTD